MSTSSFALRPKTRRHIDGFSSPIRFLLITALIARMTMHLPAAASGLAGQHRLKTSPGTRAAAVQSYVEEASRRFLIPDAWIWAVMQVESAGDVRALSSKGAIGLMQIMPKTWTALRSRHRLGPDPYDPRDNILAGAAYLRELHDRYGEHGLLAAYNAGPRRYEDHLNGIRSLPAETQDYVSKVSRKIGRQAITDAVVITNEGASGSALASASTLFPRQRLDQATDRSSNDIRSIAGSSPDQHIVDLSAITPRSAGLFVEVTTR